MSLFQRRTFIVLLLMTLLVLGAVSSGLFFTRKQLTSRPKRSVSLLPGNVDMHLTGVNYTDIKQGRKEWTLKADTMRYSRFSQLLHFDKVQIALFDVRQGRVIISSDKAVYDRKAKMVRLTGHVLIHNLAGYRLTTNELIYKVETGRVFVPGRFQIMGPNLTLNGSLLSLNIKDRRLRIGRKARVLFNTT